MKNRKALGLIVLVLAIFGLINGSVVGSDEGNMSKKIALKAKIVFISSHYVEHDVTDYFLTISNIDGSNPRRIYTSRLDKRSAESEGKLNEKNWPIIDFDSKPKWLPDGKKIVFLGKVIIEPPGLILIPANKPAVKFSDIIQKPIVSAPSMEKKPLYERYEIGKGSDLWIINEDGNNLQQLTQFENCTDFKVSPDGKKIVFLRRKTLEYVRPNRPHTETVGGSESVPPFCVIDVDTKKITILLPRKPPLFDKEYGPHRYSDFSWSPDNKKIVFSVGNEGARDIWTIDANGSNLRLITKLKSIDNGRENRCTNIYWWPDNKKITFEKGGKTWVINPDGSGLRHFSEEDDYYWAPPYWFSRDGTKVILSGFYKNQNSICFKEITNPQINLLCKVPGRIFNFDLFWDE